jgi:hypothetical protein
MKYFKCFVIAAVGASLTGVALASGAPVLDAATVQAGLMAAAPVKVSVSEQFAKTGVWADGDSANIEASDDGQANVTVGSGGVITITYSTGAQIILTPADGGNDRVNWTCSARAVPDELVPEGCTKTAA